MKKMIKYQIISAIIVIILQSLSFAEKMPTSHESKKSYKIAVGSAIEGYFTIGVKLCKYLQDANPGNTCYIVPTSGSVGSLAKLKNGEVDFAIAQQEIVSDAYSALRYYQLSEPMVYLRQLLKLHDEYLTIITKADSNIYYFSDLVGKKITNGYPLSDSSFTFRLLSSLYRFMENPHDIEMSHEHYGKYLCSGKLDAIVITTGHPSSLVSEITNECKTKFVEIKKPKLQKFIDNFSHFRLGTIKSGIYSELKNELLTVKTSAIFVTRQDVNSRIVANLQNLLKQNLDSFKTAHPVLYEIPNDKFIEDFILPEFQVSQTADSYLDKIMSKTSSKGSDQENETEDKVLPKNTAPRQEIEPIIVPQVGKHEDPTGNNLRDIDLEPKTADEKDLVNHNSAQDKPVSQHPDINFEEHERTFLQKFWQDTLGFGSIGAQNTTRKRVKSPETSQKNIDKAELEEKRGSSERAETSSITQNEEISVIEEDEKDEESEPSSVLKSDSFKDTTKHSK